MLNKFYNLFLLKIKVRSKKMKKRLLAIFTIVMLVLNCYAFVACSNENGDLKFALNEDQESYYVVGLENKSLNEIVIPATFKNKPVTGIRNNAFNDLSLNIQTITFEEGCNIQTIGDYAFSNCKLQSIVLPSSVTSIGSAFSYCVNLQTVTFEKGSKLQIIGDSAFSHCTALQSVTFPDDNDLQIIGENAFEGCDELDYKTEGGAKYLGSKNEPYFALIETENKEITSCTINDRTKIIAENAFYMCADLQSIEIPSSVTNIGSWAFYGCNQLPYKAEYGVKYLGNENNPYLALIEAENTNITSCTIHANTKVIAENAFDGCTNLQSIELPSSVSNIVMNAFKFAKNLQSVYYHGTRSDWNNIKIGNNNDPLNSATIYYYSASDPKTEQGYDPNEKYWYREGDEIKIWE